MTASTGTAAVTVVVPSQRNAEPGWDRRPQLLTGLVGKPGHTVERGAFHWTVRPADLPDGGVWVDTDAPGLPGWLRPFGGPALVGHAISVGTEPHARGRRRLQRRGLVGADAQRPPGRGGRLTPQRSIVLLSRVSIHTGPDC